MKLVYKLKDNFYNISQIKKVSNIRIRNRFEEEEQRKREDEKRDRNINKIFPNYSLSATYSTHIYYNYSTDCKTIEIDIDGVTYSCDNFKYFCEDEQVMGLFSYLKGEYRLTKEKIDEFYEFKREARDLLEAFVRLSENDISNKPSKEWRHEKCGTNTPPSFVPKNPPTKSKRELLDELTTESQKMGLYNVDLVTLEEVLKCFNRDEEDE